MSTTYSTLTAWAALVLAAGPVVGTASEAAASYTEFQPDQRMCFCMILGSDVEFAATGSAVWRDQEIYLIIDGTFGPRPPALGDELPMPWVLRPGLGGYAVMKWSETDKGFSGIPLPADRIVRYFHHPESGWGSGYNFEEYCAHSRPIADLLAFYSSIEFDAQACYDEVREVLDIPNPQPSDGQTSGCGGAGGGGGWFGWMTLLGGRSLARRSRRRAGNANRRA